MKYCTVAHQALKKRIARVAERVPTTSVPATRNGPWFVRQFAGGGWPRRPYGVFYNGIQSMKIQTWLLGAFLGIAAGSAHGSSPTVVESFGCTYLEGKTKADMDAAIEIWSQKVTAINNADLNRYQVFVLTPVRATTEFDFVWLGVSPNLAIWGNGLDAYSSSPEGIEAQAIFDSVVSCESGIWFSERVFGIED